MENKQFIEDLERFFSSKVTILDAESGVTMVNIESSKKDESEDKVLDNGF